ncbi:MAG TPA: type II toxin-antitoxin system VapC family toxin [Solirubrobacterales bacterium]|nr:type II toxin-antitoxin system VapC family toxin [Solirubrobacterales bacterium]
MKLAKVEDHSKEARAFITAADRRISSEVVMTEVRRGLHRTAADDPGFDLDTSLRRAELFLEMIELHPISRATLRHAADFFEPKLHTLDAIHVVSALEVRPIDFFVTYDKRQAKAARRAGIPTISPGA